MLNGNQGHGISRVFENISLRIKGEEVPIEKDLETETAKNFLEFFKRMFGRN